MNPIYFCKVSSPVMGMAESLRQAEEEQRCGQPPQHAEPFGDPARKAEDVMDMV